jgi:hypothetical protein
MGALSATLHGFPRNGLMMRTPSISRPCWKSSV